MNLNFFLFYFLFSLTSFELLAAKRFWVAADDGTTKYYNHPANWSHQSGGAGGQSAPGTNDQVYFDNRSTVDCVISRRQERAKYLNIASTYTGTLNVNEKKCRT